MSRVRIEMEIPEALLSQVQEVASLSERSQSSQIRYILASWLKDHKDEIERARETAGIEGI